MSLRRFLEINSHWETPLTREEAAEVVLKNCGAEAVETLDYDPVDHLLRKEIQHWAVYQAPPNEVKQNLLRAAASQRAAVDADLSQAHKRPGDELRCSQTRGHEMLSNYLVLSIQYMHVRLVA
jgi:hypothetical protein